MKVLSVDNTQAFEPSSLERRLRNSVASFGEIYHYAIDPDAYSVLLQNLNNLADDVVRIALNKSPLPTSRIFFDIKFIEDGKTIDLISIGLIRQDGATLYFENAECDYDRASPWVRENVLTRLGGQSVQASRESIARNIVEFVGEKPEFWAYYADYDWVVLCQLFGTMMDLPKGWPMFCMDIKQLCMSKGNPRLPKQDGVKHNALEDAWWACRMWQFLQ